MPPKQALMLTLVASLWVQPQSKKLKRRRRMMGKKRVKRLLKKNHLKVMTRQRQHLKKLLYEAIADDTFTLPFLQQNF